MEETDRTTELALARTDLALERTLMANERTLMAWGRTGLSQIGLGLSLFKFLEAMKIERGSHLALLIIALGSVATMLGILDYSATIARLNRRFDSHIHRVPYQLVLAMMIAALGVLLLVVLLTGVWAT